MLVAPPMAVSPRSCMTCDPLSAECERVAVVAGQVGQHNAIVIRRDLGLELASAAAFSVASTSPSVSSLVPTTGSMIAPTCRCHRVAGEYFTSAVAAGDTRRSEMCRCRRVVLQRRNDLVDRRAALVNLKRQFFVIGIAVIVNDRL